MINKMGAHGELTKAQLLEAVVSLIEKKRGVDGKSIPLVFLNALMGRGSAQTESPAPKGPKLTIVKNNTPPEDGEAG